MLLELSIYTIIEQYEYTKINPLLPTTPTTIPYQSHPLNTHAPTISPQVADRVLEQQNFYRANCITKIKLSDGMMSKGPTKAQVSFYVILCSS